MTQSSYPFDGTPTTEAQYSALFSRLIQNGVLAGHGNNALEVFGDSSGMQVKVRAGSAAVRGHFYSSDAEETLAIGASGGSTRIDYVVLRLDPTANSIVLAVVAGTPGAGAPSLTQTASGTYELPLAQVTISPSVITIASDKVTDYRTYSGVHQTAWTTTTRPASPVKGQIGYNVTTSAHEYYTGSAWATLISTPTKVMGGSGVAAFGAGALSKIVTVSFSGAGFTSAPYMTASIVGSAGNTARCAIRVYSSESHQGKYIIYNEDGATVVNNVSFHWHAIEGA